MSEKEAVVEVAERYKQWMITDGEIVRPILPADKFAEGMDNRYGLKNTEKNRFVVYDDGQMGIDMAYGSSEKKRLFFSRCGDTTEPIKYGETIAIGYGTRPSWINYEDQNFGVNLGFQSNPSCEWIIYGGAIGTPVHTTERVALFNTKSKVSATQSGEFLIHFDRAYGHWDAGYPTSQTLWDNVKEFFGTDIGKLTLAVVAYFGGGG